MANFIIPIIMVISCALTTIAQEPQDSISTQQLQEIVIKAPKVIRKSDRDVFYPSESAVKQSKDGVQLVKNLMIPSLSVNDVLGTISSSGENVQVRINGCEATMEQVRSLLPETIKRIEWMDNPGLRYKGANAVLDFIVTNPTMGGSLMTQAMQALNCAWGPYNASLKLNNGRSQWSLDANFKLTNKVGCYREYSESFTFPDGQTLTRTETPSGGYFDSSFGSLQLDYSYIKPDTTVLWVALYGFKEWPDATLFEGIMSQSSGADDIKLRDYSGNHGFTPSIKVYLEQHFSHNQILAVDFNASLYNGRSYHNYSETNNKTQDIIADVNTSIKDCNQAYAIEADYIKRWKDSRITAGVSYTSNRNRSIYENLDGQTFHQRQDKVYIFAEYFQRIKNVTISAGIGTQYTSFLFKETNQGNNSWNIRPQLSATYRLNQSSQFRLNFTSWQSAPSLAETNIAPQQIDGIQWRIGNPDLKTATSYMLTLRYNFTFPRIMGTFGIRAFTSPNAITPFLSWRENKLVRSYENSNGLQNISFFLSPQIDIIPNWLTASGSVEYRAERMKGNGYKLYNHNWSGDVTVLLQHWDFTLTAQYQKQLKKLWGETYKWGETISLLALSYSRKKWEFTAGVLCPFTKYDRGSQSVNRYNSNLTHIRLDMTSMPFVQIRYNLQWGRQKRDANRLINTDASVDQSKAGGR